MADNKTFTLTFEIDSKGAISNIKELEEGLKETGKAAKKAGEEATIFDDIKDKFSGMTAGVRKVIASMKTLKGAIAATGIGLLITAIASLVAYFKSSEEGSRKLAIATEALSLIFGKLMEFASGLAEKLIAVFSDPKQALLDFKDLLVNNIIERFNSLLEVVGSLASAFKNLFLGEFSAAWEDVKNAGAEMIDVMTGVDGTVGKLVDGAVNGFNAIKDAVNGAIDTATRLVDAQRALRDQQQRLTVENANLRKELEEQKKIAEDTSLAYEERAAALEKVGETQIKLAKNVEAQAAAEESLLRLQIQNANTYEEREELETQLAEATAARIEAQTQLSIVELEAAKLGRELQQEELDRQRTIRDMIEEANAKKIDDAFELARQELDIAERAAMEELERLKATDEEKTALAQGFANKRKDIANEEAKYREALEKQVAEANLSTVSSALGAISGLLGENSKAAKAFAVAQTTIDTYMAAQKAYASQLIPGDPTSPVRAAIAAGVAVASGLANVKAILKTNPESASATPTKPTVPAFNPGMAINIPNVPGAADQNVVGLRPQVVKAYVVSSDMTSQQERDKKINNLAKL